MIGQQQGILPKGMPGQEAPQGEPGEGGPDQGVEDPNDDSSAVSPEEQALYDKFVKNCYLAVYDQKALPEIINALKASPDFVENLAHVAANVILSVQQSAKKAGSPIPDDVVFHAGAEVLEDLANLAAKAKIHTFDQKELEAAGYRAIDLYRQLATQSGLIDPKALEQQFGEIAQADRAGRLGDLLPGASSNGGAPDAAAPDDQPEGGA